MSDRKLKSITGPPGPQGPAGAQGLSAYQVALANGFVGSEAAWLASLVGPPGSGGEILTEELPSSTLVIVDTVLFSTFNSAEYLMHFKNVDSSLTKGIKLLLIKRGLEVYSSVYGLVGYLNVTVDPVVVSGNLEIQITNNELFNIELIYQKTIF